MITSISYPLWIQQDLRICLSFFFGEKKKNETTWKTYSSVFLSPSVGNAFFLISLFVIFFFSFAVWLLYKKKCWENSCITKKQITRIIITTIIPHPSIIKKATESLKIKTDQRTKDRNKLNKIYDACISETGLWRKKTKVPYEFYCLL